jgi:dTDP-glucose 4,6-dehydratase
MGIPAFERTIAVTGGAGFIGSNLLRLLVPKYPHYLFVNIDLLTYAGNLANLKEIESAANYRFERLDICDASGISGCFAEYQVDAVIHLAAETHVDRSILGPEAFIHTNVQGTQHLLEAAVERQNAGASFRFHHVSTDEVFGALGPDDPPFTEMSGYSPNSPYAASKAAADHLVRAWHATYGLDCVITNCSNNYGPYQFPEKLLPLVIRNAVAAREIPVYGDGRQIRDWLYVVDHCAALDAVFHRGMSGETYLIGGRNEMTNLALIENVCDLIDKKLGGKSRRELIRFVKDRPGHDRRYAINPQKIEYYLLWQPSRQFTRTLEMTVDWYLANEAWLSACVSGEYQRYYEKNYSQR